MAESAAAHTPQESATAPTTPPRRRRFAPWRVALLLIVVAAFAAEQLIFLGNNTPAGRTGAQTAQHLTGPRKIDALLAEALGPSDRGVTRFHLAGMDADPAQRGAYTLNLMWAINGDLSLGSVSAGAQLDVYLVLRKLYTARLPLRAVRMTGTFGQRGKHGHNVEVPVMIVGMDAATARLIDWQNMDASTVWPLVHQYMMRPGFECHCQE